MACIPCWSAARPLRGRFPLRHGEPRDTVHEEEHARVLVAKVLGDGKRRVRACGAAAAIDPMLRRRQRCAAVPPPRGFLDELHASRPRSAIRPITDVRLGMPRQHRQQPTCQRGAGEHTKALPPAARQDAFSARTPRSSLP